MTNDLLKPSKKPLKTYRQKIAYPFENVELEPEDKTYLAMVLGKETMAWGYAYHLMRLALKYNVEMEEEKDDG